MDHTKETLKAKGGSNWQVKEDDSTKRGWVHPTEDKHEMQQDARLDRLESILNQVNLFSKYKLDKLGKQHARGTVQNINRLIDASIIVPKDEDIVGIQYALSGHVEKWIKLDDARGDLPADFFEKFMYYKLVNDEWEFDQEKYDDDMRMLL